MNEDFVVRMTHQGIVITDNRYGVDIPVKNNRFLDAIRTKNVDKINIEINNIYKDLKFYNGSQLEYEYDKNIYVSISEKTDHNFKKNLREYTLGIIKYIYLLCIDIPVDNGKIEYLASWLYDIGIKDNILSTFLENVSLMDKKYVNLKEIKKQVLEHKNKKNALLNKVERKVIYDIGLSILLEFKQLGEGRKPDVGAIKIKIDFLYRVILNRKLPKNSLPYFITLHYSTGNTLIGWEYETIPINDRNIDKPIFFNFKTHDEIENHFEIAKTKYGYLSKESQKKIATAMYQEKQISKEKSNYLVSYSGLAIELLSIVEKELKDIIYQIEKKYDKLMWRDIYIYLLNNPLMENSQFWETFVMEFQAMNILRNKAAHGEEITKEEYLNIKGFVYNLTFDIISEFKAINNI